ncbi:dCTP pyrophosphatase 1-like [Diadema antillarum]|uniref:dCTP pyrophosphatase 1-like n=1 Tax=Diadema antillarum TaxID=105358 RepID=UPI003A855BD8
MNSSNGSNEVAQENPNFKFSAETTFEELRQMADKFVEDRDWNQYHSPRNLLLAMVGEVGELAEIFQWRGEVKEGLPNFSEKDKTHVAQELSDVLIYLVRLAQKCHVDLPLAAKEKMALNEQKYPAERVRGSSKKYSEYSESGERK